MSALSKKSAPAAFESFEDLVEVLRQYNIKSVAELAEVSQPTLYFWLDGTTRKPRLDTVRRVAGVLGYTLQFVYTGATRISKPRHLRSVR